MKREERRIYNKLRKMDTVGLLNVEVRHDYTDEARQAIHEVLTIEKGLFAISVCPSAMDFSTVTLYVPANLPEQIRTREIQENMLEKDVVSALPVSEYTWNGYKKTVREKITEAYREAEKRVKSGEEVHVHFSDANGKTGMVGIDLLPLITCHGRCRELCGYIEEGKVLPPCYACRVVNQYKDCMTNYAENTALAIHRPEQYWEEVSNELNGRRTARLFGSGDMIIAGYIDGLVNAALDNPHCEIYGMTKCEEVLNRWIDNNGPLPKNLHILLSRWKGYEPHNPHNLPTTAVYENEKPAEYLACCNDCTKCFREKEGCWKAGPGDIVGFKYHGPKNAKRRKD